MDFKRVNLLGAKTFSGGDIPDGKVKEFQELLQDNCKVASEKSHKSLALFFIVTAVWVLFKLSKVNDVTFMGMKIDDASIIMISLPVIAAFFFYRFIALEGYVAYASVILGHCYIQRLRPLLAEGLTSLLVIPTILHINEAIDTLEQEKSIFKRFSDKFVFIELIYILVIPVLIMVWMLFTIATLTPVEYFYHKLIASLILLTLMVKTVLLFFQWIRNV
jgi:hypothetical protein